MLLFQCIKNLDDLLKLVINRTTFSQTIILLFLPIIGITNHFFLFLHRLLDSMKQRSSSFQISDILGLPPKENSSGDDSSAPSQTTIPPPSISSALHSSNNLFATPNCCSMPYPLPVQPLPPTMGPPKSPPTDPTELTTSSSSTLPPAVSQDINRPFQQPPPESPIPFACSNPFNSEPTQPPGQNYRLFSNGLIVSSKPPPTGGYLQANLSSSMFLESSAAAAAQHYNNLFNHGRNWQLDNSSDHYGESYNTD